ncbi:MAG: GWxTD domain-containing protein [bacterium]|nr:GWxTD domain-containing protein [bacterium]
MKLTYLIVFALFIMIFSPIYSQEIDTGNYYLAGLKAKEAGNYEKAMSIWVGAQKEMLKQGKADPRIGFGFIELVTHQKITKLYPTATTMYDWGLSEDYSPEFGTEIEKEIEMIRPLLSEEEYDEWTSLLNNADPGLNSMIKAFWINSDPTPTTPFNERLIEHWNRIHHSRDTFQRNKKTVYGSDDRGTTYVKYGKPDRSRNGSFGSGSLEISKWLEDLSARMSFNEYNLQPEYEVWLYFNILDNQPLIFMFGKERGWGSYGLRTGVEDFIPNRAFRRTSAIKATKDLTTLERAQAMAETAIRQANGGGNNSAEGVGLNTNASLSIQSTLDHANSQNFIPGSLLQLIYYGDLVALDMYFESKYSEIERLWTMSENLNEFPRENTVLSARDQNVTSENLNVSMANNTAPRSDYERIITPYNIDYSYIRMLNDERPFLAVIASSTPKYLNNEILKNFFIDICKPECDLVNTFIIYDNNWNELDRVADVPSDRNTNFSTFFVHHIEPDLNYEIIAEEFRQDSTINSELLLSSEAVGTGKMSLTVEAPLSTDMDNLEISDMIAGKVTPEFLQNSDYPFPVIPAKQVSTNDTLFIYLEIYHLFFDSNTRTGYNIKYYIYESDGEQTEVTGKDNLLSMESSFSSISRDSKEILSFNITDIKPGDYVLCVEVTDVISGQTKKRSSPMKIIK